MPPGDGVVEFTAGREATCLLIASGIIVSTTARTGDSSELFTRVSAPAIPGHVATNYFSGSCTPSRQLVMTTLFQATAAHTPHHTVSGTQLRPAAVQSRKFTQIISD